ncbi:MAG TPA: hypothetical protein VER39_09480 [Nocardioidaceae bacterium]|nr:hypothetical protein [Nocardioidaceae bacterium]
MYANALQDLLVREHLRTIERSARSPRPVEPTKVDRGFRLRRRRRRR